MTLRTRALLSLVGLMAVAALVFLWRGPREGRASREENPAPAPVSSGVPPFSPAPSAPSAITNPLEPTPQPLPATVAPAEAADASAPNPPEADVERRQDAKIARGLSDRESGGVLVLATPPGSVAGALHLKPGDLITAVNGRPLTSTEQFVRLYREEGLPTQLTVQREGREVHIH